jgi:glycine cleavage system aminomethyltransferase T
VSVLGFLSVYNAKADGHFRPVAKSSMERRLRDHGASFEERGGWLVAMKLPHEHELGIRDVSHLGKLEVCGDLNGLEGVIPITPARGLLLCDFRETEAVQAKLAKRYDVLDVTGALAGLEIFGPGAETVMHRITAHDLDDLPAAAPVSHVGPCVLTREGPESFRIFFPQEYGHYLWEVAVDAAEPLHGGPAVSR